MSKIFGSQIRETLAESGYKLISKAKKEVILESPDGGRELWFLNDHHAGYTIEIKGKGYEFAHSV